MASSMATKLFSFTGIPVAEHKTEGPTTSLTFLGILIDTLSTMSSSGEADTTEEPSGGLAS